MNEKTKPNDQVMEWLGAYHDGELNSERAAWVEAHLPHCPECRRELEALRSLAGLLHDGDDLLPNSIRGNFAAGTFAASLPAQAGPRTNRLLASALRYLPLGLFGGWAFLQAVIWVTGGLLLLQSLIPSAQSSLGWLLPDPSGASSLMSLLCGLLPQSGLCETLSRLNALPIAGGIGLFSITITAVAAALFLSWLAGLWAHNNRAQTETV